MDNSKHAIASKNPSGADGVDLSSAYSSVPLRDLSPQDLNLRLHYLAEHNPHQLSAMLTTADFSHNPDLLKAVIKILGAGNPELKAILKQQGIALPITPVEEPSNDRAYESAPPAATSASTSSASSNQSCTIDGEAFSVSSILFAATIAQKYFKDDKKAAVVATVAIVQMSAALKRAGLCSKPDGSKLDDKKCQAKAGEIVNPSIADIQALGGNAAIQRGDVVAVKKQMRAGMHRRIEAQIAQDPGDRAAYQRAENTFNNTAPDNAIAAVKSASMTAPDGYKFDHEAANPNSDYAGAKRYLESGGTLRGNGSYFHGVPVADRPDPGRGNYGLMRRENSATVAARYSSADNDNERIGSRLPQQQATPQATRTQTMAAAGGRAAGGAMTPGMGMGFRPKGD